MREPKTQEKWEIDRLYDRRCEKCGSADIWDSDWRWDGDGYDTPCAYHCDACGVETSEVTRQDRPFIAPGEPGSHDQPGDYEEW